jgi:hypothetical protein
MRFVKRDRELDLALRSTFEQHGIFALRRTCRACRTCNPQCLDAHSRRPIRLNHESAAQFLHHHQHIDRTAIEAALFFRHRQCCQAEFRKRRPMRIRYARVRIHDSLARFETVVLVEVTAQRVGELLLFVGKSEVHRCLLSMGVSASALTPISCKAQSPRIICAMMFF